MEAASREWEAPMQRDLLSRLHCNGVYDLNGNAVERNTTSIQLCTVYGRAYVVGTYIDLEVYVREKHLE